MRIVAVLLLLTGVAAAEPREVECEFKSIKPKHQLALTPTALGKLATKCKLDWKKEVALIVFEGYLDGKYHTTRIEKSDGKVLELLEQTKSTCDRDKPKGDQRHAKLWAVPKKNRKLDVQQDLPVFARCDPDDDPVIKPSP